MNYIYAHEGLSRYVQFMKICKSEMYNLKKILRIEKISTISHNTNDRGKN